MSSLFNLYIIGVSNVGKINAGPWKGWSCIGNSFAFGPGGKMLLKAPFGEDADTVLFLDLETIPRPARGNSWYEYWTKKNNSSPK